MKEMTQKKIFNITSYKIDKLGKLNYGSAYAHEDDKTRGTVME